MLGSGLPRRRDALVQHEFYCLDGVPLLSAHGTAGRQGHLAKHWGFDCRFFLFLSLSVLIVSHFCVVFCFFCVLICFCVVLFFVFVVVFRFFLLFSYSLDIH